MTREKKPIVDIDIINLYFCTIFIIFDVFYLFSHYISHCTIPLVTNPAASITTTTHIHCSINVHRTCHSHSFIDDLCTHQPYRQTQTDPNSPCSQTFLLLLLPPLPQPLMMRVRFASFPLHSQHLS